MADPSSNLLVTALRGLQSLQVCPWHPKPSDYNGLARHHNHPMILLDAQAEALPERSRQRPLMSCRKEMSPTTRVTPRPRLKAKPAALLRTPSMPLAPRLAATGAPSPDETCKGESLRPLSMTIFMCGPGMSWRHLLMS